MKTLANHPALALPYLGFSGFLMDGAKLPHRPRELIVLRIASLCDTPYEWINHVEGARQAGLTEAEIAAIPEGPAAAVWAPVDRALLEAIDQLFAHSQIADATWAVLADAYDRIELMEMVFTIGHYVTNSWAINAFGIEPDSDREAMIARYLERHGAGRSKPEA